MATNAPVITEKKTRFELLNWLIANPVLGAGILAVLVPTLLLVARESWSTEQGAHGPIVLATGLWLLWREWQNAAAVARPAPGLPIAIAFAILLPLYFVSRVSNIVETEGFLMYGLVVAALFSAIGWEALKRLWFPLIYLLFVLPPPETLVAMVTNPLKIMLSESAVGFLYLVGYPVASSGVTIQVGQYQLLVAEACAGLNSLISLSAISLFYVYLRHHANVRYALLMIVAIVPVAVFANFVRIVLLVLLTYHGGEAAAQGFLHDFAGLTMFMTALITIFAIDHLFGLLFPRLKGSKSDPVLKPAAEPAQP
ncbi:exosortase [Sphingobium sp. B1D7B]|uniref:exosortase V n=1 Tax=Sphingobium TaxID=165695 RepID=UPI0015EBE07E|nr:MULTISPECIES: exosortase V [Sphingobium]MCW2361322.1 exosortase [Sphingobium sp. B10D3B]MCW2391238.1 exosortase [Sphingobium sp. B11D3A]MCW2401999.1 exosortase [Sphingobium sp. B10D7B]MCW2406449.1 exosortase [Sphingobium sp. B1D7B]MCW2408978.1 exosortase [Sphingobium xanthum]